jgi:antitoxin (DNA-binding transcriptional repressor) of toxin-antitoxin stability system
LSESSENARVGVRELRQNLSVYLRRVEKGEILDVTEHGHLVARMTPAPGSEVPILDRMIAEGRASAAIRSFERLPDPIEISADGRSLSETLLEMRDEDGR